MTDTSWAPAPRQGLVPLYPFGFGQIMGRSFAVLKGNPKVLLLFGIGIQLVAYTVLMAAVVGLTFLAFSRTDTVDPFSDEYDQLMAGGIAIVAVGTIVLSLLIGAVTIVVQAVIVAEVGHASLAEKAPLARLWKRAGRAFWPLVGYSFLALAAALVAMALLVAPIAAIVAFAPDEAGLVVGILWGILALLGGFALYLWLGTKLYYVPAVIVLEHTGPIRAIRRSWRLTRGRFWPTLGVFAMMFLISQGASIVISVMVEILMPLIVVTLAPFGGASDDMGLAIAAGIVTVFVPLVISIVLAGVLMIVTTSAGVLSYIDARMRDEGIDLRMQRYVEAAQSGDSGADPYPYEPGAAPSQYAPPPGAGPLPPAPIPPVPPLPAPPAGPPAPPAPPV